MAINLEQHFSSSAKVAMKRKISAMILLVHSYALEVWGG